MASITPRLAGLAILDPSLLSLYPGDLLLLDQNTGTGLTFHLTCEGAMILRLLPEQSRMETLTDTCGQSLLTQTDGTARKQAWRGIPHAVEIDPGMFAQFHVGSAPSTTATSLHYRASLGVQTTTGLETQDFLDVPVTPGTSLPGHDIRIVHTGESTMLAQPPGPFAVKFRLSKEASQIVSNLEFLAADGTPLVLMAVDLPADDEAWFRELYFAETIARAHVQLKVWGGLVTHDVVVESDAGLGWPSAVN